jgi:alanyl-tRNA synthetase
MNKAEAEIEYGFSLYQGGIVPGNNLRVVNIEGVDTEACCGTHCDNTAEVGRIRLLKSHRISDGIVRLNYVAGEKALVKLNEEDGILHHLCKLWGISLPEIVPTAERFFQGYKKLEETARKQQEKILALTVKSILCDPGYTLALLNSDQANPTLYFSFLKEHAENLKNTGKGVVFIGNNFLYGLLGKKELLDVNALLNLLKKNNADAKIKAQEKLQVKKGKGKPVTVEGAMEFSYIGSYTQEVKEFLFAAGFKLFE